MKPLVISIRALALAWAVAAAGACSGGPGLSENVDGGRGGTAGIRDAGVGGTTGKLDAAVESGRPDVAAGASGDTSDAAADGGPPEAGDARGDEPMIGREILCPLPTRALITDFTYVPVDGGTTTAVGFGDGTGFSGTEYVYPVAGAWPITSDVTGNDWHISGNVGDYSGFGIRFAGCNWLDASAYRGISFTISGLVAPGRLTMGVGTASDTIAASWLDIHGDPGADNPGRCIPSPLALNQFTQSDCVDPTATIPVTAGSTVHTVFWSDFSGGKPEAAVSPDNILSIYWFFSTPPGVGTPNPLTYPVDIVIDDLALVP
jgi:hypothetical protein